MISLDSHHYINDLDCYPVMIDGRHAGYVEQKVAQDLYLGLKHLKIEGKVLPK